MSGALTDLGTEAGKVFGCRYTQPQKCLDPRDDFGPYRSGESAGAANRVSV